MTIAELRALLETLPKRFDDTEVMISNGRGLVHVALVVLDRQRTRADAFEAFIGTMDDRQRARKLKILGQWTYWHEEPPEWRLRGWWPAEAAEIGLEDGPR